MGNSYDSVLKGIEGHKEAIRLNEQQLATNPAAYKASLKRFAILGYVLYSLILFSAVICGYACYWLFTEVGINKLTIYFAIFTVVYLYATIASLFIRFQPSFLSLEVTESEAPELWNIVRDLAVKLDAPKVDRIYLSLEMNASAMQWPRFGLFGKVQNFLTIGIPLMMSLDEECLKTVIAHEFGHFAGAHGKESGFVYRSGQLFGNLYTTLAESNNLATIMIRSIVNWYYPRLEQKLLPVSRVNEYEADRVAVRAVGAETFRRMMIKFPASAKWFDTYVMDKVISSLPEKPVSWMAEALRNPIPTHLFEADLSQAIKDTTDIESTHPCLNDRLKAQGIAAASESEVEGIASQYNIALEQTAYESMLNESVKTLVDGRFGSFIIFMQADYREKSPFGPTGSIDSLFEQESDDAPPVQWIPKSDLSALKQFEDLCAHRLDLGEKSFVLAVKSFAEAHISDPMAAQLAAIALVEFDAPYAIEKLKSINTNPSFAMMANQALVGLYSEAKNEKVAGEYYEIAKDVEAWLKYHGAVLVQTTLYTIHPPELSPMQLEEIKELVAKDDRITAAYLGMVQNKRTSKMKYKADVPVLFIDCLSAKQSKWRWTGWVAGPSDEVVAELQGKISTMVLPIAMVEGMTKWYGKVRKSSEVLKIK